MRFTLLIRTKLVLNSNSYLRDILGDILGNDMHYPFTRFVKPARVIPQSTAISNIKLPILKKEEYHIWAMEMEHYLEYIDNDDLEVNSELILAPNMGPNPRLMTMRTKPEVDTLSIDDLYNTLGVFESEIKIAMIAIRMKKFYKKIGRRVRVDGKTPVGFDKKKLECFNCHNTSHFARECTAKGTHDGKKKRDSFYQHQEAGKQEKNQMGLLTMDDGIKLVNTSRAKKLEKSHDPLALVAYMGWNATNELANVQRIVRTPTPGNTSTGQCYNCGGKGHYARNCPKPRVRDSKYFMEQMLLAKQDEAVEFLLMSRMIFLLLMLQGWKKLKNLSAKQMLNGH
ncbi:ribonuclease H-like domain-containing protein [Tanacetum coccineum]|uniref:Ribonuclease H-like domain-containing protein n=1 Tax=Tanacetum coccineum TaxID=301880 RepID=A0ABQ4Z607_9ASTR